MTQVHKSYGPVAYIVTEKKSGEVIVNLVIPKPMLTPLKHLSLPRLELMGALIGARLSHYLKNALPLENAPMRLWTDSTVAVH